MRDHCFRVLLAAAMMAACPLSVAASQTASDRSAEALADEVREIRALLERTVRSQSEIQRMSIALNAHRSRMIQVTGQLDAVRREMNGAAAEFRALEQLGEDATNAESNASTADGREEAAGLRRMFEPRLAAALDRERQMRNRETALVQQLLGEEATWNELAQRLTQLTLP